MILCHGEWGLNQNIHSIIMKCDEAEDKFSRLSNIIIIIISHLTNNLVRCRSNWIWLYMMGLIWWAWGWRGCMNEKYEFYSIILKCYHFIYSFIYIYLIFLFSPGIRGIPQYFELNHAEYSLQFKISIITKTLWEFWRFMQRPVYSNRCRCRRLWLWLIRNQNINSL